MPALFGTRDHALAQVRAGVDILVVAGGEAGGHCGAVATMVLVPEVAAALDAIGDTTPILAAGGIVTGRQMAAAMAMGAHGAWCGSVRSEEHTSELQSLMRISYAVFRLKKKTQPITKPTSLV